MEIENNKMKHLEDDLQEDIIRYCNLKPELRRIFAIPNGGKRDVREAARLKAQGVKAGVCDLCLPLPIPGMFHGLFLELKVGNNKPTASQKDWLRYFHGVGYYAAVGVGFESAKRILDDYLYLYKMNIAVSKKRKAA